jgi:hypothetical protein
MPPKDALRVREVDKGSKAAGGDSLMRQSEVEDTIIAEHGTHFFVFCFAVIFESD